MEFALFFIISLYIHPLSYYISILSFNQIFYEIISMLLYVFMLVFMHKAISQQSLFKVFNYIIFSTPLIILVLTLNEILTFRLLLICGIAFFVLLLVKYAYKYIT